MTLQNELAGQPVELAEMLQAREERVQIQQRILRECRVPLVSFVLNIAGPIKVFPLAVRTFEEGCALIRCQCKAWGIRICHEEERRSPTGCECFFSADAPPEKLKRAMTQLEESTPLGRLFDIDVLNADGDKYSRAELGLLERPCLVCGKPAFACSRSRAHTLAEILTNTCAIMADYFAAQYAERLAAAAARALLYEVLATPKPGLVDKNNAGAHRDMDIVTFETSALALLPYFKAVVAYGIGHCGQAPGGFLRDLKLLGLRAEVDMLRATGGVNTHKGMIFSLGLLLAALGLFYGRGQKPARGELRAAVREIAAPLEADFEQAAAHPCTNGERSFASHGVRGARGEALEGFPALFETALPTLDAFLAQGASLNDAGVITLLHILAATLDTNLIARSSYKRMEEIRQQVRTLLDTHPALPNLLVAAEVLDRMFIAENLSPGGSADLLALAYFIRFLEQDGLLECGVPK